MEEFFCSGYCRRLDASRMVTVEIDNNQVDADCDYGSCPYEPQCSIATKIHEKSAVLL